MELVVKSGLKIFNNATSASYLMISIKDTGMGLKEVELDGLFEPYTQLYKINKKDFIRSVSLSTVKILLEKLKGTVWAESEIMKGTTFNIILPVEKGIILEDE